MAALVDELESLAASTLTPNAYDFFRTGARDEHTVEANRRAWASWQLVPRVLVDVTTIDLAARALGIDVALPLLVAPMSLQRLAHPDGELATARASARAGAIMIVSTGTSTPLEEIADVPGLRWWFQLYALDDRSQTADLVRHAVRAGARAIVLTVDAQAGPTQRWPEGGLQYPPGITEALVASGVFRGGVDQALDWDTIPHLQDVAGMPIVVKGILHPADAERSARAGVGGIVVSNHGGRSLDGAVPTATALSDVVDAVHGGCEIYVDGGLRRGADILRALALGARAAVVGRPFIWGLAHGGEAGVAAVFEAFRQQLEVDAALCGVTSMASVPRDLVRWGGCGHGATA